MDRRIELQFTTSLPKKGEEVRVSSESESGIGLTLGEVG